MKGAISVLIELYDAISCIRMKETVNASTHIPFMKKN